MEGRSTYKVGDSANLHCWSPLSRAANTRYQWYRNGSPISGANSERYTTEKLGYSDHGKLYRCRVVVNNVESELSAPPLTIIGGYKKRYRRALTSNSFPTTVETVNVDAALAILTLCPLPPPFPQSLINS